MRVANHAKRRGSAPEYLARTCPRVPGGLPRRPALQSVGKGRHWLGRFSRDGERVRDTIADGDVATIRSDSMSYRVNENVNRPDRLKGVGRFWSWAPVSRGSAQLFGEIRGALANVRAR